MRLSEKHGVNPALVRCYYCNGEKGDLVLFGRLPNDAPAPTSAVIDHEPCGSCADIMRHAVVLISVRDADAEAEDENPYRTGGWVGVTEEFVARVVTDELARNRLLRERWSFVPDTVWDRLGLPRGPVDGIPSTPDEWKRRSPQPEEDNDDGSN